MDWTKSGRTDRFRYVRVSWPDFEEIGEINNVTSCKVEENALSDLRMTGTLSKIGDIDLGDSVEDMVRIYSTSELGSDTETVCHGTFKASAPASSRSPMSVSEDISLYSILKVLQDEVMDDAVVVSTSEDPIVRAGQIAARRKLRSKAAMTPGAILTEDKIFDAGTNVLEIVSELVSMSNYTMTVDAYGNIIFRPYIDPSQRAVVATFSERGAESLVEPGYRRERDLSGVYNVVTVVGEDSDGNPLRYQAINNDSSSPWSIAQRGRKVSAYVELSDATTQDAVQAEAIRRLKESTMIADSETINHLWTPFEMYDSVRLDFPKSNVSGTYSAISRTCEMSPGMPCQTVVRRYVDITTTAGE